MLLSFDAEPYHLDRDFAGVEKEEVVLQQLVLQPAFPLLPLYELAPQAATCVLQFGAALFEQITQPHGGVMAELRPISFLN